MAIPSLGTGKQTKSLSVPRTPTQAPGSAGIVSKAVAKFGGQAAQLFTSLEKKRNAAQTQSDLQTLQENTNIQDRALKTELNEKYGASDHKGYAEEYAEKFNDFSDKALSTLEGDSLDLGGQFLSRKRNAFLNSAQNKEILEARNFRKANTLVNSKKAADSAAISFAESGDMRALNLAYSDQIDAANKHLDFSPAEKVVLVDNVKTRASDSVFTELLRQKRYGQAEELLNSDSPIATNLSVKQRKLQQDAINRGRKTLVAQEFNSTKNEVAAFKEIVTNSGRADMSIPAKELMARIDTLPVATERQRLQKDSMKADLYESAVMMETKNILIELDPESFDEYIKDNTDALHASMSDKNLLFREATVASTRNMLERLKAKSEADFKKDPMGYFIKHSDEMEEAANEAVIGDSGAFTELKNMADGFYDERNIPENQRVYTTPTMRLILETQLKTAKEVKDPGAMMEVLNSMTETFGSETGGAMASLKVSNDLKFAAMYTGEENKTTQIQLVSAMLSDSATKAAGKQKDVLDGDSRNLNEAFLNIAANQAQSKDFAATVQNAAASIAALNADGQADFSEMEAAWDLINTKYDATTINGKRLLVSTKFDPNLVSRGLKSVDFDKLLPGVGQGAKDRIAGDHFWKSNVEGDTAFLYDNSGAFPVLATIINSQGVETPVQVRHKDSQDRAIDAKGKAIESENDWFKAFN